MDVQGPSAQELMTQLEEFMQRCEKMLDENIEPDLTGMDSQVEKLQGTIHELKFDELQNLQPSLQGLMDKLKQLEDKLRAQRDKVRSSLQDISSQKQAHSAYSKMQAVPSAPNGDEPKGDS